MLPFQTQAVTTAQMMYLDELIHRHRRRIPLIVSGPGLRFTCAPQEVVDEIDAELARMMRRAKLLDRAFNMPASVRHG